jgi:hypothetical protein
LSFFGENVVAKNKVVPKKREIKKDPSEKLPAQHYDTAWKQAFHLCGQLVIAFFLAHIKKDLKLEECDMGYTEYYVPLSLSSVGKRVADCCFTVPLRGVKSPYKKVVLLIEQQHRNDKYLPLRLFQLYQRAKFVYPDALVITFALLTGKK